MAAHLDMSLLRGIFCPSLRDRRVWRVLEPVLKKSKKSASQFQEHDLQDHDFVFQLGSDPKSLRVLLLSPSSLGASKRQETIARLKRFSSYVTSNRQTNVVGFLACDDPFARASRRCNVDGIVALQVLITESLEVSIPIIPIPNPASLLSSIQQYMTSLVILPVVKPELEDAIDLLARTHRSRYFKMSERDITILTEMCPNLVFMSQSIRDENGKQMVKDYFGDALGTEMIRYWEEDEY